MQKYNIQYKIWSRLFFFVNFKSVITNAYIWTVDIFPKTKKFTF